MQCRSVVRLGLLPILAALACGCGGPNRVGGTVTYEGAPIEKGQIIFVPSDGKGPAVGGSIVHGKYMIADLEPGAKTVQIVAALESATPVTGEEEMIKRGPGGAAPSGRPPKTVPPNAEGNNVTVEVKPGDHILDFNLKKPVGTKGD